MTTRYNLGDFNIANPVYAGATVSFYTVSGGAKTTTLATLYAASTGTTQGSNPATLDSDGKLSAPLYSEVPVVATISGLGSVDDHDTGIIGLAEGSVADSAAAAAASAAAALVSENNAETAETNAETAQAAAEAAVASVGARAAATVGGTVDVITATFSPAFASLAAQAGIILAIPLAGANATTTPTLEVDGLTAKTIVKGSNVALVAGDIPGADFVGLFCYDASLGKYQLLNPVSGGITLSALLDLIGSVAQGDILYRGASAWARLGAGVAGKSLKTGGAGANPSWANRTLAAIQATTSGTTKDFTIPSGATDIDIVLDGVSTNGTSSLLVQIGNGTPDTSGYTSGSAICGNAAATVGVNSTAGFVIGSTAAANVHHGIISLRLKDAATFSWGCSHAIGHSNDAAAVVGGGSKSLSAELTVVRITSVSGDTFDAGSIGVSY